MPVYKKYDPLKIYKWGDAEFAERTNIIYRRGAGVQDYEQLKTEFAGQGWDDPEFPHDNKSIGVRGTDIANLNVGASSGRINWYRVKDVLKTQTIHNYDRYIRPSDNIEGTFSTGPDCDARKDIRQGGLGTCFFVASVSAIAMVPKVLEHAVPSDNLDDKDSGVYHFRFWYRGCWVDVPVDDWLPFETKNGNTFPYASTFNVCDNKAEFWVMLVEKAYAKLHGSYGAINGGSAFDALQNLTGGFVEQYKLQGGKYPADLFDQMSKNLEKNSLISLSCQANEVTSAQAIENAGLCQPHAYTVTKVATVQQSVGSRLKDVQLVRIRNPHGQTEWKGEWSDYLEKHYVGEFELSDNWSYVSEEQKKELQVESKNEGEFWMAFTDMVMWFSQMDVVAFLDENQVRHPGFCFELYDGEFSNGKDGEITLNVGKTGGAAEAYLFAEISQKKGSSEGLYGISFNLYENSPGSGSTDSGFGGDPQYAALLQQLSGMGFQVSGSGFGGGRTKIEPIEGTTEQRLSVTLAYKLKPGEYTLKPTGANNGWPIFIRVLYTII